MSISAGDATSAPQGLGLANLGLRLAQVGIVGGALGAFAIRDPLWRFIGSLVMGDDEDLVDTTDEV